MKKRLRGTVLAAAAMAMLLLGGCSNNGVHKDGDFIKGADISSLQAVEDYGGKFYDAKGREKDVLSILKESGFNYLRLRIWNEPTLSFDKGDYCDLEHTVEVAKRIKKEGMKYLLNFHYSDWWADPENQRIPKAWEDMNAEEMAAALYDYTCHVLKTLDEAGAYPDIIQIGNEIGNGMLWDVGRYAETENFTRFINSGIKAVRDTTPAGKDVQIMIHIEYGGSVDRSERFFDMITQNGVTDFDIIGLSYYPYWHGTVADLKDNINNLYAKYGKKVSVVEFAFPFTDETADDTPNIIDRERALAAGFEPSVENQKLVTELVMNAIADCEGGMGVFYWEPAWLAVKGAGAVKGGGNAWENQCLFDFNGNALDSITAFKLKPGKDKGDKALTIYPTEDIDVNVDSTKAQLEEQLPKTVKALYSNGDVRDVEVSWDTSGAPAVLSEFTSYTFTGTAAGFSTTIVVTVIHENLANNLNFEDGPTGWVIEKTTLAGIIRNDGDSFPKSGRWSFHYWDDRPFSINLYQTVLVGETADFTLALWSQGAGGTMLALRLYIADEDGVEIAALDFRNEGWNNWRRPAVTAKLSEGAKVRIGVRVEGQFNDWGTIDDFSFYKGLPLDDMDTDDSGVTGPDINAAGGPEGNILKNGGFEEGTSYWDIDKDTVAGVARNDDEGTPRSGLWSFHYWADSPYTIDIRQTVTIETPGEYTFEAWNQGGESETFSIEFYLLDGNGNVLQSATAYNDGWANWQQTVIGGLQFAAGDTVTVGAKINGGQNDWGTIDDLALYPGSPQTGEPADTNGAGDNLLQNPGFEDGDTGWITEGKRDDPWGNPQGIIRNDSAGASYTGSWYYNYWWNEETDFAVYQTVTLDADGTYALSVWAQGSDNGLTAELFALGADGTEVASMQISLSGGWQQFTLDGVSLTAGTVTVGMRIHVDSEGWSNVDDFTFYKVE